MKLKLFERKLEFWELFENWNFGKLMEILKIGILENYLRIAVLKIKFENWYFEKLFENGILKIENFEELFENWIS